ncbi:hypothetical protein HELRODRAFT_67698 [Helobdella robusta]|uniref:ADP-ribosylation factor-like protein 6 n=1 Tax=Helobdella robusta TaxID=6412 RepID=T1FZ41_HELRO|nr:hypothetical protein HELRODRAFT_67698 [Helobdella robusta]ESN96092.1 hypothetical protein HELRODRAFT_67698 [Helobdella robusta]
MGAGVGKNNKAFNVAVIGLDNSGKTTILKRLNRTDPTRDELTAPTIGLKVRKLRVNSLNLTCFDMSGQGRYRNLWQHYYRDCDGLIFVIDSSDRLRLPVAKEELELALNSDDLRDRRVPLLLFANKSDLKDSIPAQKCGAMLGFNKTVDVNKPWWICSSNGLTGEGLEEGFEWLTNQIKSGLNRKSSIR